MKQQVTFSQFTDSFRDMGRAEQFSYQGLRALYEYLQEYEDSTGEEVELDVIALCVEYSEYPSATECIEDCGYDFTPDLEDVDPQELEAVREEQALEWLEEHTTIIKFDGGIIIQAF